MVLLTVVVCISYAGASVSKNGWLDYDAEGKPVPLFNKTSWPNTIGIAVYAFEGIGVILPIQDITEDKENYFYVVCITCAIITAIYLFFAEFCLYAWYYNFSETKPLITSYLPPNIFTDLVKLAFAS